MPSRRVAELVALLRWQPVDTATLSWATAQERLGITFPDDYKELMSVFGTGVFDNVVGVISPVESPAALAALTKEVRERLRLARANEPVPYRLFPDRGGLFPWAEAGDGCTLFWRTDRGGPNDWTIAFCDADFSEWEEFDGSASEFIFELISGHLHSDIIDFEPIENPTFGAQRTVDP